MKKQHETKTRRRTIYGDHRNPDRYTRRARENVCGQFDAYLKKIERTLHVTMILARDGEIKVIGPESMVGKAARVYFPT